MKELSDGYKVSARSYYYLLDWNEVDNWKYMQKHFGTIKLRDLTILQYRKLFREATTEEMINW